MKQIIRISEQKTIQRIVCEWGVYDGMEWGDVTYQKQETRVCREIGSGEWQFADALPSGRYALPSAEQDRKAEEILARCEAKMGGHLPCSACGSWPCECSRIWGDADKPLTEEESKELEKQAKAIREFQATLMRAEAMGASAGRELFLLHKREGRYADELILLESGPDVALSDADSNEIDISSCREQWCNAYTIGLVSAYLTKMQEALNCVECGKEAAHIRMEDGRGVRLCEACYEDAEQVVESIEDKQELAAWMEEELRDKPLSLRDLRELARARKQAEKRAQLFVRVAALQCSCGQMCVTEGNDTAINAPQVVWCDSCGAGWDVSEQVFAPRPLNDQPVVYIA